MTGEAAQVLRRDLDVRRVNGLVLLDALADPVVADKFRVFFAQGANRAAFSVDPVFQAARTDELREISGGLMQVCQGPSALAMVTGVVAVQVRPAETALFEGRDCALAHAPSRLPRGLLA